MRNYFKPMLILLLAWVIVLNTDALAEPLNIAVITWRGQTQAEKGFKDGLKQLGYDAIFHDFDAGQDLTTLSTILRLKVNPAHFDYIYTFGTTVSLRTKLELKGKVPQLFAVVAFPVQSGLVASMDKPGGNISGATHYVSIEKQISTALDLFKFKTLNTPFNPREENAEASFFIVKTLGEKYGFAVNGYRMVPNSKTLQTYLEKLRRKAIICDAVYLPSDSFIISQSKTICDTLLAMHIPSIAAVAESVKNGALIGVASDYFQVGQAVAEILDQHQKGTALSEIPVAQPTLFRTLINPKTAKALNITVDPSLFQNTDWIK